MPKPLQAEADLEDVFAFPREPQLGSCYCRSKSGTVGRVSMMNPKPMTLKADKSLREGRDLGLGEGLPQVTPGRWGVWCEPQILWSRGWTDSR